MILWQSSYTTVRIQRWLNAKRINGVTTNKRHWRKKQIYSWKKERGIKTQFYKDLTIFRKMCSFFMLHSYRELGKKVNTDNLCEQ